MVHTESLPGSGDDQRKPLIPVVAVALLDQEGRCLLAQRPHGKDHGGLWEFPGGKIEARESPEQALLRELREELGVEPCKRCFYPFSFTTEEYNDKILLLLLYICRRWDGFAYPLEGQELSWTHPRNFSSYDLAPADKTLAQALHDHLHQNT